MNVKENRMKEKKTNWEWRGRCHKTAVLHNPSSPSTHYRGVTQASFSFHLPSLRPTFPYPVFLFNIPLPLYNSVLYLLLLHFSLPVNNISLTIFLFPYYFHLSLFYIFPALFPSLLHLSYPSLSFPMCLPYCSPLTSLLSFSSFPTLLPPPPLPFLPPSGGSSCTSGRT